MGVLERYPMTLLSRWIRLWEVEESCNWREIHRSEGYEATTLGGELGLANN